MGKKWTNRNLPGALHYVTASCHHRAPVFKDEQCCLTFFQTLQELREQRAFKLVAYVLMPDHCHLIVNPRDGDITVLVGALKGITARQIIDASNGRFRLEKPSYDLAINQVWQESFKAFPLWSDWMIWQKINYIHKNPLKAQLVKSSADYWWSSFRAFYFQSGEPLAVDKDWWWPDDVNKLEVAMAKWNQEISNETRARKVNRKATLTERTSS